MSLFTPTHPRQVPPRLARPSRSGPSMQKHLVTCLLLLASSGLGSASASLACAKDIGRLQKSEHFLRGPVGAAGHRSEADLLFEKLLRTSNSETVFLELAYSAHATNAARAFGVCGLSELRSKHLPAAAKYLQRQNGHVLSVRDGVAVKRPLSQIAAEIVSRGCAVKKDPAESLTQWPTFSMRPTIES